MLGTLNGALEVRGISIPPEDIEASVEGINEIVDGLPVLTRVLVHYTLRAPAAGRQKVERALETHAAKCPTAASLAGSIDVEWTVDLEWLD